jgi:hypothetical protein
MPDNSYPTRKGEAIVAIARRMLEVMWIVTVRKELNNQTTQAELDKKLCRPGLIEKPKKKRIMEPAA